MHIHCLQLLLFYAKMQKLMTVKTFIMFSKILIFQRNSFLALLLLLQFKITVFYFKIFKKKK